MLNELKNRKRIGDMKVDEQGFLLPGSIIKDENGAEWLNLNGMVSTEYRILAKCIRKISSDRTGYEIYATDFITANADMAMSGNSEVLKDLPDIICLSDMIADVEKQLAETTRSDRPAGGLPNREVLEPLYSIFLEPDVLNTVLMRTSIPEILNHQTPIFNGVILYGKGGTGKTALQKAISAVYKNAGGIAEELNVAQLSEKFIGSLANNLDARIGEVLLRSEKAECPAFIFLDEASSLVMSSATHNESGVDYYQEAVDVLKKYISNYPNLVFSITTNMEPDTFDDTLIREGRLHPIHIGYPGEKQKMQMWEHFLKLFDIVCALSDAEYRQLAEAIPEEQGAFINEFCKSYIPAKKLRMEADATGSESLLDVLAGGHYISIEKVRESINFDAILEDLISAVEKKYARKRRRSSVGFLKPAEIQQAVAAH